MTKPIMITLAWRPPAEMTIVSMSIDPFDPDFQGKMKALQALGYTSEYDSLAEQATANHSEGTLPDVNEVVTLDKSDPDFEKKKEVLKARGYKWDKKNKNWRKPAVTQVSKDILPDVVTLDKSDRDFEKKKAILKARGYKWDKKNKNWRKTAVTQVSEEPLPDVVTLDKSDPDFFKKKERLKAMGYRFDSRSKNWRKPANHASTAKTAAKADNWWGDATEVKLSQDDPDYEAKKAAIKAAGAKWDSVDQVWVLPQNVEEAPF